MNRGGYQIIDLKDVALSSGVGKKIPHCYEQIESTRKLIVVSGLNLDGVEYHDISLDVRLKNSAYVGFAPFAPDTGNYIVLTFEFKDDTTVTVTKTEVM